MPGYTAVLTNQMLVYKHRQVIPRIVIPRIESVAKTPTLNLRINLGISSDLGITHPRFILPWHTDSNSNSDWGGRSTPPKGLDRNTGPSAIPRKFPANTGY